MQSLEVSAGAGGGSPVASVPTLTEWGIIALGLALGGVALRRLRAIVRVSLH